MQTAKLVLGLLLVGLPTAGAHANPEEAVSVMENRHVLPLMPAAADAQRQGFARIINRSRRSGTVSIYAIDDAGERFGPVELALDEQAVAHFDAGDLECGNAAKGLSTGTGVGQGDWRLELMSELDIRSLAFARSPDGFVTRIDEATTVANHGECEVGFFNPASRLDPASRLRLTNTGDEDAEVTISGLDDHGAPAPEGDVGLTLPAGESRAVTAEDLESGAAHLRGRLGSGAGRWRLTVSADEPVAVMNLLESAAGDLAIPSACEETGETKPMENVVVNADGADGIARWGTDPYELSAASISGDTLSVTVSYGGGCADHAFTLVLDNAFRMMDPVRLQATLAHEANDDPCEAWLTEDHHFDLTPVKTLYQQEHGTVVLVLDNAPEPELTYTF